MGPTPLAGERLRPLGHLSGGSLDKEKRPDNQQARRASDGRPNMSIKCAHIRRVHDGPDCTLGDVVAEAASPSESNRVETCDEGIPVRHRPFWRSVVSLRASMVNDSFMRRPKSWLLCNNAVASRAGNPKAALFLVAPPTLISNVGSGEGARRRVFFIIGDGAGNAVLRLKDPYPYLNL